MSRHKVWKFGNDIDTDAIIPGRFLADWNREPAKLSKFCFADFRPDFAEKVQPGDIIVAGRNFGCGSSRQAAPASLKMAGVAAVVAESFARIFYRNAINIGLLVLEASEAAQDVEEGEELELDLDNGVIRNLTRDRIYQIKPVPPFLKEILELGGLVPYVQRRLGIE
jgi:3-isopropylmalate/(R)-2-methylmalate dehydratase small subunit